MTCVGASPITSRRRSSRGGGFTLVEILVGVAIGMIGVVIIMQVMQLAESRRRTTSGSNEAVTTGVLAFFDLQRQIRQAGYGFTMQGVVNCALTLRSGVPPIPLAPLTINPATTIVPAGDVGTDTMLIISGDATSQTEGNFIQAFDSSDYTLQMSGSFRVGDYVFPSGDTCLNSSLTRVTALPSDIKVTTLAAPTLATQLINLGANPSILAYAVRGGTLTVCDYMLHNCAESTAAPAWTPAAGNIVSLKAQYGQDTSVPMDTVADTYDQASPANACGIARAVSVRLAIVARSSQYESRVDADGQRSCDPVSPTAPTWDGSATLPIDLSASASDWMCYRYRTFQTVLPLRNVLWMRAQGC